MKRVFHHLLTSALAALPLGSHAGSPIAGQWMCASSPVILRSLPGLPDGTLSQRFAYSADLQGRWTSNASLLFRPLASSEAYPLRTQASGQHALRNNQLTEQIRHFTLLPPFDQSSATARQVQRNFNAWVLLMQREMPQRRYRLQLQGAEAYLLEPLLPQQRRSLVRIACRRLADPVRP